MRFSASLVLAALVLEGCGLGARRAESTGHASSAIQGGVDDPGDSYAVGVCGGVPGSCQIVCSGTLLAPNLVLTARHCVEDAPAAPIDCATATFGGRVADAHGYAVTTAASMHQAASGWHSVEAILTPGPGQDRVCGDDVALLLLADQVDVFEATPATPEIASTLTDHAAVEPVVATIGYGLSSAAPSEGGLASAGYRRLREDAPIVCIPGDPAHDFACTTSSAADGELEVAGGACDGDSGSGAFEQRSYVAGAPLLVGVLARGGNDAQDPTQCTGGVYTRVDRWGAWLMVNARAAADRGGYPPPVWAAVDAGSDEPFIARGGCVLAPSRHVPLGALIAFVPAAMALLRRGAKRRLPRQVS